MTDRFGHWPRLELLKVCKSELHVYISKYLPNYVQICCACADFCKQWAISVNKFFCNVWTLTFQLTSAFFFSLSQSVWRRWSVCERAASPSACVGSQIPFPVLSASLWCFVEEGRVWTCAAHRKRRHSAGSGASELSKTELPTWARRRSLINILQLCFQFLPAHVSEPERERVKSLTCRFIYISSVAISLNSFV